MIVAATAALAGAGLQSTFASTAIFTGAGDGNNWGNGTNWTTGGVAGVAPSNVAPGDDISFNTSGQINLGLNRVANSLTFNANASLDAQGSTNSLTLTTGNINMNSDGFINAMLLSNSEVNVIGGGQLNLLNPANNFANGLNLSETLNTPTSVFHPVVDFSSVGALGGGPITLSGGTLQEYLNTPGTITQPIYLGFGYSSKLFDNGGGNIDLSTNRLSISGAISGPGQLGIGGDSASMTFTGGVANTYTSGTEVFGGTLILAKTAGVVAIPSGQLAIIAGGTVELGSDNQISTSTDVDFIETATLNLNGYSTEVGSLSGGSAAVVSLGLGTLTTGGDARSSTFAGSITGAGSLIKIGGGVQTLSGSSSFSGGLAIEGGILQAANAAALGNASVVTMANGATLDLNGQSVGALPLTLNGSGVGGEGALINSSLTAASYAGAVVLASDSTFGGVGTLTLSGAVNGSGGLIESGLGTLTLSGGASFTGGLNVTSGTVCISSPSNYSGGIILGGGTLSVNADTALGIASNGISFSNGGTLTATSSFSTGRSFTSTGGVFNLIAGATVTDSGTLLGSGTFTQTGSGVWRLTSANPFTGSLVVAGGTLSLAGPSGAMGSVSGIDLLTTGTLELNSSTALGGNHSTQNRINDLAPITLDGGTLSVLGADGTGTTETLGPLIPHFGASTISLTDGNGSGSSVAITFASLGGSGAGSTISFSAPDLGNTEQVFFAAGVVDGTIFNGGVTVNGTDFAKYSSTQGVIPFARADYMVNVFAPGSNVKLDPAVVTPPVPGSVGTVSIQTLNISADVAAVAVNQSAGSTLTLTKGGLLTSGIYPATVSGGTLTSSSGELDIFVGPGGLTLSSALSGSFVLTKRGTGTLALTGTAASTYTGFTLVSGEMDLNKSGGAIAIPGNLIIDGGTLKSLASGQIASTATVTLNYGTWNLNGQTENISQLVNNTGTMLFNGGTLNVSNGVLLAGGSTTVASILTSQSLLTVSGGDNEIHSDGLVTTQALAFLGNSPAVQIYSDASTPGKMVLAAGGNLSFSGGGTGLISSAGTATMPGVLDLQNSTNHTITVSPGDTMSISAQIINGGFTVQGGGTLQLTNPNTFTGANTFAGGITIGNGTTLLATNTAALGNGSLTFAGGTLELKSDLPSTAFSEATALASTSLAIALGTDTPGIAPGVVTLDQLNAYSGAGLTLTGTGSLNLFYLAIQYNPSATGPFFIHNAITLSTNYLSYTPTGISAPANVNVVKDQTGQLIFNAANSFGDMTVNAGLVSLNSSNGLSIPNNLTISGASIVQLDQSNQIAATSNVTLNAATGGCVLDLNNFSNTLGGLSFVTGGAMNTGSGVATLAGNVNYSGVSGTAIINGNLNLGTATPTFNISSSSTAVALQINANISSGSSSNLVGINKTGTGILALMGNNTFTGPINISGGSVLISGAIIVPIVLNPGGSLNLNTGTKSGILVRSMNVISLTGGLAPYAQVNVVAASSHSNRQLIAVMGLTIAGISNAWQGRVDLADNDLDAAGGALADVTNQIKEGYNGGKWNGAGGIISTTAAVDTTHLTTLGVIQNNQSGSALFTASNLFDTTAPGPGDILVKSTYYGDTNLDGKVDGSDYSRIDAAYLADKTNPTAMIGWYNGDFNYDGVVNGSDYTLIDNAFNTQGTVLAASIASPQAVVTAQIAGTSAVPEPATMCLLAIGAATLLGRPRASRIFKV